MLRYVTILLQRVSSYNRLINCMIESEKVVGGKQMLSGEKIRRLRLEQELSQKDLAEKLEVSRQAIAKWETNRGIPDIDNLKRIAQLF